MEAKWTKNISRNVFYKVEDIDCRKNPQLFAVPHPPTAPSTSIGSHWHGEFAIFVIFFIFSFSFFPHWHCELALS